MTIHLRCPYCRSLRHDILSRDGRQCRKCGQRFFFTIPEGKKHYQYFSDENFSTRIYPNKETDPPLKGEEIGLPPRGQWLYGIKNLVTREYKRVIASSFSEAAKQLGWEEGQTRMMPIKYGGVLVKEEELVKQTPDPYLQGMTDRLPDSFEVADPPLSDETRQSVLRGIEQAKAGQLVDLGSFVEKKTAKVKKDSNEPSTKSLVIEIIKQENEIDHQTVLDKIFEILKTKAEKKGGRSDEEHLKKRAKLTYYFYRKEVSNDKGEAAQ